MIFRQLFDSVSGTYTYLLASRRGAEALLIDPVLEKVDRYVQLIEELDLRLVKAVDTHLHADHITGLGALRDRTQCVTVMGERSKVDVVSMRLSDGDRLTIEGLALDVIYTPGHTDDSYSFVLRDRVFTGDTLLIRGTGRTDFQNGDARAHPKMMDVAVPANMRVGLAQEEIARRGWAVSAQEAIRLSGAPDVVLVDLRERSEREKHGVIPGSLHAPYPDLGANVRAGGMLNELARATGKRIVFYCAFGERSAMAVRAAQDAGLASACHIAGGVDAWRKADGPLTR
jgi:rhodanese-related sulfurtransferase